MPQKSAGRRNIMENLLKNLFDYQKFSGNPKLRRIIDDAHSFGALDDLSDDELAFAAGGVNNESPPNQTETKDKNNV